MQSVLDRYLEALAAHQHGLVTLPQALAAGATRALVRHRLESGRWHEVRPRVYRLEGALMTSRAQILAAILSAGSGACASHRSAAALHGIAGFELTWLEITVPRGRRPRVGPGVHVHDSTSLPGTHVEVIDGIPLTTVARTLFDLAGELHPKRVTRAFGNCLAGGLVTLPAVWRVLQDLGRRGRRGTEAVRELLLAEGEGEVAPASELESRLLAVLGHGGLPQPAREVDLGDADGWVGRVDFVYRDAKVLIEADSRRHHSARLDRQSDQDRDNRLMASGWRVLRFDWDTITRHPDVVVRRVRAALTAVA